MPSPAKTPAAEPVTTPAPVVRVEVSVSTLLTIVLVVAGLWLVIELLPAVLVLVMAFFIASTVSPLVEWFEGRRVKRIWAITIVFTALLIVAVLLISLTIPELLSQIKDLAAREPELRAKLVTWLSRSPLTASFAESVREVNLGKVFGVSAQGAFALSTRVVKFFAYSMGAIFLALYGLIDRDRLRGWLFALVPRRHHMGLSRVMLNLETIVGGYIRGQLITSTLIAVFMFVVLFSFGVPNALALAVFGGLADVLPYVGALLTILPAFVAALGRGPGIAAIVLALMLVYEEFESRVLVPLVYGRALRLPSSVVLFALIAGGTLAGIVGALLALPVAAAILMLIEELRLDLPGQPSPEVGDEVQAKDERGKVLYASLTKGMPAEQAAAIAVELADERKKEEAGGPAAKEDPARQQ